MREDAYVIRAHTSGRGGGPVAGAIGYWGAKALCYGAFAATGTVLATGAITGATTAVLGEAIITAGVGTGGTVATGGATAVAGAITGTGLATEAGTLSVAVVTSAGGG